MAPEVWRGERGPAADLYALGVTLHHLLRGAPASDFRTRSAAEWLGRAFLPLAQREPLPAQTPSGLAKLFRRA